MEASFFKSRLRILGGMPKPDDCPRPFARRLKYPPPVAPCEKRPAEEPPVDNLENTTDRGKGLPARISGYRRKRRQFDWGDRNGMLGCSNRPPPPRQLSRRLP